MDQVPPRFAQALAIASGDRPIYLQQPTSFYFPGLPQIAWYAPEMFPWVSSGCGWRCRAGRAGADPGGEQGLEPYVKEEPNRPSRGHSLLNDARWSAFHLWEAGKPVDENARRCPLIMELLERAPIPRIKNRSPIAGLDPQARHAYSAASRHAHHPADRHIPLIIAGRLRLRVGAETRDVIEGKAMIFDDSFEHEAWNDGDSVRAVLLFEIWRPELDEAEKIALTAMFEAVATGADRPRAEQVASSSFGVECLARREAIGLDRVERRRERIGAPSRVRWRQPQQG